MSVCNSIAKYCQSPNLLAEDSAAEELAVPGMAGYAIGSLGLFAYLRLEASVFPGLFAFIGLMLLILFSEALVTSLIHFFLSLSGKKGQVSTVFYLFGCSNAMLALAVPIGIAAKFYASCGNVLMLGLMLYIFILRLYIIRKAYSDVSVSKTVFALIIPGILFQVFMYFALIYGIINSVWLMSML
ncbi:MAG: hypothetical protein K5838_02705 [Elusimicrobiales bacterium]|nr:hypothetical protein [Elusimicrobiales bacterium]